MRFGPLRADEVKQQESFGISCSSPFVAYSMSYIEKTGYLCPYARRLMQSESSESPRGKPYSMQLLELEEGMFLGKDGYQVSSVPSIGFC